MKYLIVPTQHFSGSVKGMKEAPGFEHLPKIVQKFLRFFKHNVFGILDESSWIKTTTPTAEEKKSQRTRTIKVLTDYTESRAILTGTLMSKSPLNVIDQFQFLDKELFDDNVYAFAERYCVMMNLRTARGRRVLISQLEYSKIRKRMVNAFKSGGEAMLSLSRMRISNEYGIDGEKLDHIMTHKTYSPFMRQDELTKRIAQYTTTVRRSDVFDIGYDEFVYNPIKRPVELGKKAKALGNELVKLGFTDNLVLGKAPALELQTRLTDICNGFEPIEEKGFDADGKETRTITYRPLDDNPKLDELCDLLEEIGTEQNQVLIWCARTNALNSISERLEKLGISHVRYSGSESEQKKKEAEELFANGEARVFLANQRSAGFGLNCLKDCAYMVWYCSDGSVEAHYQAMHRILRGESTAPKFAYQIYVQNSVEERNARSLNVGKELLTARNPKSTFLFT